MSRVTSGLRVWTVRWAPRSARIGRISRTRPRLTLDWEVRVSGAAEVDALAAEVAPQAADFVDGVLLDEQPVAPGLLALGRVEGGGVAVGAAEAASPPGVERVVVGGEVAASRG